MIKKSLYAGLKSYLHLYLINWFIDVWMIDRLFDWLIDCLIDWLIELSIDWLISLIGRLIGWWIYHLMILLGFNSSVFLRFRLSELKRSTLANALSFMIFTFIVGFFTTESPLNYLLTLWPVLNSPHVLYYRL